ncbi:trans-acting enoyl reductase family protein [Polaromonas sp. JS666]|uniref:saccharopine dehydrogenase family protein n=1 Tax=Polaromonas sp. (strain JS666 / ATCC BAA-500) TaxID=296591 RepID=UPI00088B31E6|nr:saccharopine dehydrogenase NADP-binding domain-containing protein [Polaromonas sp. JS666]SDM80339.1 Saccharopine dehydrogenase NADP binding domain-containing protein [Polaromonas sp. JS666]
MTSNKTVAVYGAYGHTGRFVVSELRRRGWTPILSGRDAGKLQVFGTENPGLELRPASVDEPASLDRALAGAAAVINCAGPFASTSAPLIEAAMRARIPYLDVAAEIEANIDTFNLFADRAREAGIVVVHAMAFYGGLGDLLATAAMGDWTYADEISIAYGLDSWRPTPGTLIAGQVSKQRRDGRRVVFADGKIAYTTEAAPATEWTFPAPLGKQPVIAEFTMADTVTISRHIKAPRIHSYMTAVAVRDLTDPNPQAPVASDESGQSPQTFVLEVLARRGGEERRAIARGRDIYAFTAPLVVEAMARVVAGQVKGAGVFTAGEAFDARDFLASLSPANLSVELR